MGRHRAQDLGPEELFDTARRGGRWQAASVAPAVAAGQRAQVDRGRPALRPIGQSSGCLLGRPEADRLEEPGRFGRVEGEVFTAEDPQLSAGDEPRLAQAAQAPATDDQAGGRSQVGGQREQDVRRLEILDPVDIIDDQAQAGDRCDGRAEARDGGGPEGAPGPGDDGGGLLGQGCHAVDGGGEPDEQGRRIAVPPIRRQPGRRARRRVGVLR